MRAVVLTPAVRGSCKIPNLDLGKVSEWTLNESKIMTMIVSRSWTMHAQSPPLIFIGSVLKESDDPEIHGVTFDSS